MRFSYHLSEAFSCFFIQGGYRVLMVGRHPVEFINLKFPVKKTPPEIFILEIVLDLFGIEGVRIEHDGDDILIKFNV